MHFPFILSIPNSTSLHFWPILDWLSTLYYSFFPFMGLEVTQALIICLGITGMHHTACILYLSESHINCQFYPFLGQDRHQNILIQLTSFQLHSLAHTQDLQKIIVCLNLKSHQTLFSLLYSQHIFTFMLIFIF